MRRLGRAAGSIAVITLLVAACGGGGGGSKSLSEDDFIDELNSICKSADRSINRLDSQDRRFFDDVLEVMQNGADELADLKPPSDFEKDYKDFADNLDDQIKATEDLSDAVADEDDNAIADAQDDLSKLADDANDLADDIGVDDCVDIGAGVGGSTTDTTVGTTGDTTDDTTGDTTDETTANTPLPIDTTPPTTSPPATAATVPPSTPTEMTIDSGGDGLAQDAETAWSPPAGWTYAPNDPTESNTPFSDPILGPVVTNYWVGLITNDTTGQTAYVYISETAGEWTNEQVEAIFSFEAVGGGVDVTTPLGNPGRIAIGIGDTGQYDAGAVILQSNSLSIFTLNGGEDMVTLLDEVFAANSMGG